MRDFKIDDIPTRTGWDERLEREQFRARVKTALGWIGLCLTMFGIGAIAALTTFPR